MCRPSPGSVEILMARDDVRFGSLRVGAAVTAVAVSLAPAPAAPAQTPGLPVVPIPEVLT
jgi:hypothetical protein